MNRRSLMAGAAALAAVPLAARPAASQTATPIRIVWWHSMTGALADQIARIVKTFNTSQSAVELTAIYKGSYADTLTAAIAAFRAGQAPHLVQVFEVGTGTMLAAGRAVKQIWELSQETGIKIDPANYIPAVRGYYSLADGRMGSMPFNSSTAIVWYNKDAFAKAGLDPDHFPATWAELVKAAQTLASKAPTPIPCTTSWFTWIQFEEFSAIHNIPFATQADGFAGLDATLLVNSPHHVKQLQRFLNMAKDGSFKYTGRDSAPDAVFYSGQAAIGFGSSSGRGDIVRNAKFNWAPALLPYDPEIIQQPINSIIGGASLWSMTAPGRTPEEYKAVAQFLSFLGTPEQDAIWSQNTGYVPVTLGGYALSKQQGYYEKNPGTDLPVIQLTRGHVTDNSRGIRLGRLPEIRNVMYEEVETAMQGKQTAQQALDNSVSRGNAILRQFERSVKG
jgi:sn-glycerol 3-phosphate transport system substrate-binding protein